MKENMDFRTQRDKVIFSTPKLSPEPKGAQQCAHSAVCTFSLISALTETEKITSSKVFH